MTTDSARLQSKIDAKLNRANRRAKSAQAPKIKPKPLGIHAAARNAVRVRFAYTTDSVDDLAKAYRLPRDIALRILRHEI